MELKTYYDFAENDYCFFQEVYKQGIIANSLGATAQNICERYLKYLIDTYITVSDSNVEDITAILKSHNINRIVDFWNDNSDKKIDKTSKSIIGEVNGFYFSTRYPGDDSVVLSKEDIDTCFASVEECKRVVDRIINQKQK